jgi:hypothetical protein
VARTRNFYQVIERRRWEDVRSWWLGYIPIVPEVGQRPDPTLSEFLALSGTEPDGANRRLILPGIRQIGMTEAIFLFQKSMHVARAVESSARNGMLSWAVFQGYHSAYYAAKGFLALLGACFPQPAGRQLLVDLFPIEQRRPRQVLAPEDREIILTRCAILEQHVLWGFFGRLLRVAEFSQKFQKQMEFLSEIDHEHIPRPRNRFIYQENHWPYEDLVILQQVADFAFKNALAGDFTGIEEDDPIFLAVLGMVVPSLLRTMFDELVDLAPALGPHITFMDAPDWVSETQMVRSYF